MLAVLLYESSALSADLAALSAYCFASTSGFNAVFIVVPVLKVSIKYPSLSTVAPVILSPFSPFSPRMDIIHSSSVPVKPRVCAISYALRPLSCEVSNDHSVPVHL